MINNLGEVNMSIRELLADIFREIKFTNPPVQYSIIKRPIISLKYPDEKFIPSGSPFTQFIRVAKERIRRRMLIRADDPDSLRRQHKNNNISEYVVNLISYNNKHTKPPDSQLFDILDIPKIFEEVSGNPPNPLEYHILQYYFVNTTSGRTLKMVYDQFDAQRYELPPEIKEVKLNNIWHEMVPKNYCDIPPVIEKLLQLDSTVLSGSYPLRCLSDKTWNSSDYDIYTSAPTKNIMLILSQHNYFRNSVEANDILYGILKEFDWTSDKPLQRLSPIAYKYFIKIIYSWDIMKALTAI